MLLRFGVQNHLSLKDETALTLTKSALDDTNRGLISTSAYTSNAILPAAVIYGANASGKSNVISAMRTMQSHVLNSHSKGVPDGGVPWYPFILSKFSKKSVSKFEIDFVSDQTRYSYGYETDGKEFTSEWLYSYPQGRRQKLFERERRNFSFGRSFKGQNKTIEGLTRNNSLFISCAAQNSHEEASKIFSYIKNIYFDFRVSVSYVPPDQILTGGAIDPRIIKFLSRIGTGIVDYTTRKLDAPPGSDAFISGLNELLKKYANFDMSKRDANAEEKLVVELGRKSEDDTIEYFDFDQESSGTKRLMLLLSPIFFALDSGSVIVIDELDASLHTQAVEALLALFSTRDTNPNGAQIIATVHDTNILRSKYLRRDQVWFTDKNELGVTTLFPLSDVQTRKNDNLEKGYLEGRYGAVPFSEPIYDVIMGL